MDRLRAAVAIATAIHTETSTEDEAQKEAIASVAGRLEKEFKVTKPLQNQQRQSFHTERKLPTGKYCKEQGTDDYRFGQPKRVMTNLESGFTDDSGDLLIEKGLKLSKGEEELCQRNSLKTCLISLSRIRRMLNKLSQRPFLNVHELEKAGYEFNE